MMGQIFLRAFGQLKIFLAPSAQISLGPKNSSAPLAPLTTQRLRRVWGGGPPPQPPHTPPPSPPEGIFWVTPSPFPMPPNESQGSNEASHGNKSPPPPPVSTECLVQRTLPFGPYFLFWT